MEKIANKEWKQNIGVLFVVTLAYVFIRLCGIEDDIQVIQSFMRIGMAVCIAYAIYYRKRLDEKAVWILISLGFIMRIGYMLYTPCMVRSHDLWGITLDDQGHAGYLLYLFYNHRLPDSNGCQFYQQPLFYLLGIGYSTLLNGLLGEMSDYYLVDAAKCVSCGASCISLLLSYRIGKEVQMDRKGIHTLVALVAFLPAFYITGGTVNADALAGMFMLYALLYTLRWMKDMSWKNTIILAVLFGCGVMTKVSCGVVAVVTAVLFIQKMTEAVKRGTAGNLSLKYLVFGCISLPLGLWYSVRNYFLFGQKVTYVPYLGEESPLFTGDHTIAERLFTIDIANLLRGPYAEVYEDYNAPVYYVKSALFGEFKFYIADRIPSLLLFFGVILSVYVFVSVIWQFVKNRKNTWGTILAVYGGFYYINSLWFYYKFPHGCSMDFRYMTFLVIPFGVLLGNFCSGTTGKNRLLTISLWGFSLLSCLMYSLIG